MDNLDELLCLAALHLKAREALERAIKNEQLHHDHANEARAKILAKAKQGEISDTDVRALLQAKRQAQVNMDKAAKWSRERDRTEARLRERLK